MSAQTLNETNQAFLSNGFAETASDHFVPNQFQAVVNLNNEGIRCFVSGGKIQEAMRCITRAKCLLDGICRKENVCGKRYINNEKNDWNLQGIPELEAGSIFIYNKPIVIAPGDDLTFCKAALLFNTSLIYHTIALQRASKEILSLSLMLYDLSFQTFLAIKTNPTQHLKCHSEADDNQIFRFQFYALAAWNNQAHLHILRHSQEHAQLMLQGQKAMVADLYERAGPNDTGLINTLQLFILNIYQSRIVPAAGCA